MAVTSYNTLNETYRLQYVSDLTARFVASHSLCNMLHVCTLCNLIKSSIISVHK